VRTFPVVFTGHVDHGKSTLVSRLLLDTGYFPDGKLTELERAAQRRGVPLEISFLLDSFQVERDQAITIDATRIWFCTAARRYAVIDAPGHREFVRHMVSGAADALAAVVVVDAAEGLGEQTRRHALLLPLVGVTRAIVAVNKMDTVGFSAARYAAVKAELEALFVQTGLTLAATVPTVARDGDNVARPSTRMPWYGGPSLLEALELLDGSQARGGPVRFAVHDVYRRDEERILVGNVGAGRIQAGATLTFAPSRDRARVKRIVRFPASDEPAVAGEAIGMTLDHPIFVGPGDVASEIGTPPQIAAAVKATVFWLDRVPLAIGEHLRMRCGTRDVTVVLDAISGAIDIETFEERPTAALARNDIAQVTLRGLGPLVVDLHPAPLARFALYRGDAVGGGGIVRTVVARSDAPEGSAVNDSSLPPRVTALDRMRRYGHRGLVVWLTGGTAGDAPALAAHVEAALFFAGAVTAVVVAEERAAGGARLAADADDGAAARRCAAAAAALADAGCIAIVVAPGATRADLAYARDLVPGAFIDVRLRARLAADADGVDDGTDMSPAERESAADVVIDDDPARSTRELLALIRAAAAPR
jgi:bifunctional enzyme CysN/CysC